MATSGTNPNKTSFVREELSKNPASTPKSVNAAWKAAGHEGPISNALVSKVRGQMRLASPEATPAIEPAAAVPEATAPASNGRPAVPTPDRSERGGVLEDLEGDLDRLLFRIMGLGGLPEVEDALRKARRILILSERE